MTNQNKSYLFALTAILFWSTIASALNLSLQHISFAELLFFASITSFLLLFTNLWLNKKLPKLLHLKGCDFLHGALLGLLNPFLYYLVLLKAYALLPAQEAGTLNYIWPIVLVLLSIPLLKQKIGFASLIAILISFAGTVIIGTRGNILSLDFSNSTGVALCLVSAIFWALFWIFNLKDKKDEVTKLFLNFGFGLVYIFLYLLFTNGFNSISVKGIVGSVYIGLFEMGFTYILWLKAMKLSSTTAKISNLVFLSPFISLIIIHFVVGETILPSTIAGLMLIVSGILLQRFVSGFKKG